jgi:hypothetical protein
MHYKDYSGEITFDVLGNYFSIGLPFDLELNPQNEKWRVVAEITLSILMNNMELAFQSRLGTQEERESFKFNSLNVALQPAVILSRKMQTDWPEPPNGLQSDRVKGECIFQGPG